MKLWSADAFERGDAEALALRREGEAGKTGGTIDVDRAAPAGAVRAAEVNAEAAEFMAQNVRQKPARLDIDAAAVAIDGEFKLAHPGPPFPPARRRAA